MKTIGESNGTPGESAQADVGESAASRRSPPDDLEDYLEDLRELGKLRRRAESYGNDEGCKALEEIVEAAVPSNQSPFRQKKRQPKFDVGDYALALRVLRQLVPPARVAFVSARLKQLGNGATLEEIKNDEYSVLLAAEIMRGLVFEKTLAFTRPVFICWYWIRREIFIAADPDWCIGAARAGEGGWVTAYVTGQCVPPMLDFADALDTTAKLFAEVDKITFRLRQLSEPSIPRAWHAVDLRRLSMASIITFSLLSKQLALSLDLPTDRGCDIKNYVERELPQRLLTALYQTCNELRQAYSEIKNYRKNEFDATKGKDEEVVRRYTESETAHKLALTAIAEALSHAKKAAAIAKVDGLQKWGKLSQVFSEAAKRVREGLQPTRNFFSAVIDHQLGATHSGMTREWQPLELASAAAAFSVLAGTPSGDQERLWRACVCLGHSILADGTIPSAPPYHRLKNGTFGLPSTATMVTALAALVKRVGFPVEPEFAAKLFPYFEHTRADEPHRDCKSLGWSFEYARRPRQSALDHTAYAVEALVGIGHMLDSVINNSILKHFSVRQPDQLQATIKVGLDDLFYPDYGFFGSNVPRELRRESVAITLQKMREHVCRTPTSRDEKLRSLVLYGPPGTGKTTLVEALALTSNVPLVEITPSDIAKGGEGAVERRARTVFEALSLLTQVVILFDEFDPVLKSRDASSQQALNIFSFLTPGMLPKLKLLDEKAKTRSFAYILITNLVGTLDEAAIRSGRFDEKVGIYAPDPLSRCGQLMMAAQLASRKRTYPHLSVRKFAERAREVICHTQAGGMTALARRGWFVAKEDDDLTLSNTPMRYIFTGPNKNTDKIVWPEPEAKREGIRGKGREAEREYLEWGWLASWDDEVANATMPWPTGKTSYWSYIEKWPNESTNLVNRLKNDVKQTKPRRLLTGLLGDEIVLRWKEENGLFDRLQKLFMESDDPQKLKELSCAHMLSPEDLYIFKQCAERVFSNELFEDTAIVSHIVYIHLLAKDFLDHQEKLTRLINSSDGTDRAVPERNELKRIFIKIDTEIKILFSKIVDDYEAYVESSDFINNVLAKPLPAGLDKKIADLGKIRKGQKKKRAT